MRSELIEFAKKFLNEGLEPVYFTEEYMRRWKKEGDAGGFLKYPENVDEAMSTLFCIADNFSPRKDRRAEEFDEEGLRAAVLKTLVEADLFN